MKVYLASSFKLKEYVEVMSHILSNNGIETTVKWWEMDFKKSLGEMSDNKWYSRIEIENIRKRNFKGIDDADVLILVCHPSITRKFNGANVEVGYALAKGKTVFSMGALERSGMYQEVQRYQTPKEIINVLLSPDKDRLPLKKDKNGGE